MLPTEIALIVMSVAICILVLILIATLLTIKRTSESVGNLAEMLYAELKPTLQELSAVLAEMNTLGVGMAEHTDDVKRFMAAMGEIGTNLNTINRSLSVATGVLNTTTVWATGARVAGKYMLDRYLKKRGGM